MEILDNMITWMTRTLWRIIWFVITLLLLAIAGGSYYMVYAGLRPSHHNEKDVMTYMYSEYPHLRHWTDSLHRNYALKDTAILSPDSLNLHAYYIKAPKPTLNTAVVVHGHRCQAARMFHIAYMFQHDMGFNVLLPDLRSHGKSEGDHIQMGWNDRKDLIQWIDVANGRFRDNRTDTETRMVLYGESMGAATVMMTSGEQLPTCVKAIIEDCGYTSVAEEFAYVGKHDYNLPAFPIANLSSHICKYMYGWSYEEASALEAVKRCQLPMFFIHGTADTYVPTEMVYRLYQAKPRDKAIWTPQGSMHARSYHDYPKEYTRQVKAFINSYLYK